MLDKEQELLLASKAGDIEKIKELLQDPSLDINALREIKVKQGFPYKITPLVIACRRGLFDTVLVLTKDPRINMNARGDGDTPFQAACKSGSIEMVKYLLRDIRVEFDQTSGWRNQEWRGLLEEVSRNADNRYVSKERREKYTQILSLLLVDERVNLLEEDSRGNDAFSSVFNRVIDHVNIAEFSKPLELFLAVKIDASINDGKLSYSTIKRASRALSKPLNKSQKNFRYGFLKDGIYPVIKDSLPNTIESIRDRKLELRFLKRKMLAAELFTLIVLYCDDMLRLKNNSSISETTVQFFSFAKKLPMDAQMVLCNRVFSSEDDIVTPLEVNITATRLTAFYNR
jgi:hypothetical protein